MSIDTIVILPQLAGHILLFPIPLHQGIQAVWKFLEPEQVFTRAQTPGRARPGTTVSRLTFEITGWEGGEIKKVLRTDISYMLSCNQIGEQLVNAAQGAISPWIPEVRLNEALISSAERDNPVCVGR